MDIACFETGDGGDVILRGNDVVLSEGLFTMTYLGLFGGNTEDQQNNDGMNYGFWGNQLLHSDEANTHQSSETEKTLNQVVLNSQGRAEIAAAIQRDLAFMKDIGNIEVNVALDRDNKVLLQIKVTELAENNLFSFLWDGVQLQEISKRTI